MLLDGRNQKWCGESSQIGGKRFEQDKDRLNRFGLLAAALGMCFGHTASDLFNSFSSDIIMPALSLVLEIEDWQSDTIQLGSTEFKWGEVLKDSIRFLFIAISVFLILHWMTLENEKSNDP